MQSTCAILSFCGLSGCTMFPHYLINGAIFGEVIDNEMCVFSLQLLYKAFLILSRTERDVIKYVHRSSCKVTVIVFRFKRNFYFRKILISNFMKILPVGAELFRVDGWTDRHGEVNSRFSQF